MKKIGGYEIMMSYSLNWYQPELEPEPEPEPEPFYFGRVGAGPEPEPLKIGRLRNSDYIT